MAVEKLKVELPGYSICDCGHRIHIQNKGYSIDIDPQIGTTEPIENIFNGKEGYSEFKNKVGAAFNKLKDSF